MSHDKSSKVPRMLERINYSINQILIVTLQLAIDGNWDRLRGEKIDIVLCQIKEIRYTIKILDMETCWPIMCNIIVTVEGHKLTLIVSSIFVPE